MIRSMTCFSRVSSRPKGAKHSWVVEIRSVNHRYFEFSLRIPNSLNSLENRIRDLTQATIRRGKISIAIAQDSGEDPAKGILLDEAMVRMYLGEITKLKKKFRVQGDVTLQDLLKMPGVFSTEQETPDGENNWKELQKVLEAALKLAVKSKETEGKKLAADIEKRLSLILKLVQKIEALSEGRSEHIFKKLSERIDALLQDKERDPDRIAREVAMIAERSDITEELVRLKSHLELFHKRIQIKTEVGRELDFLCQEMHREINTMGSKSQLFEIATEVVAIKGEIEKIREQVQNIE